MNSLQFIPFIKQGITLLLTQDTGSFYKKLFLPEIKGLWNYFRLACDRLLSEFTLQCLRNNKEC